MIIRLLSSGPYYVRVNRTRILVRDIRTGQSFECAAKIGVDDAGVVLSVGDPVDAKAARTIRPFDHPRVIVEDYASAEKLLSHAVRRVANTRLFVTSPVMVVHPDLELEGGLTQIESRVLRELAESCGARKVFVHYGRQLADPEINALLDNG